MKKLTHLIFFLGLFSLILFIHSRIDAGISSANDGYSFKDTTVKVIWREDVFDSELKQMVNTIKLNDSYFANISDPEKAIIGYLATTIGNECYSDGSKSNVKCKILSALNLGYQCSETNKSFLRGWFKDNTEFLSRVENCQTKPSSKNVEKTFDMLTVSTKDDIIKVDLRVLEINFADSYTHTRSEEMTFRVADNKLNLMDKKMKD